jgi:diketogulonate reductase-like aldo/keto reductase
MVGAAITGSAALAAHRVLISEADRDAADKNSIAYGGLSTSAARRLREQRAASLSEQLRATAAQIPIAWHALQCEIIIFPWCSRIMVAASLKVDQITKVRG